MRIAALHLPGFLVQAHVRVAPHLGGTAFGVLQETEGKVARITALSRAALGAGAKVGMTATQARAVAPGLRLVDGDPGEYQAALAALGEALLALSVTVEVPERAEAGALYLLVPPGARGASFGERVIDVAAAQGFVGRVGIADDRFTAWAATRAEPRQAVRAVASGGSAAFLAPLPLALLPLDPDVRRTLGLLGVRTLGDFAALPPPSVGRRWGAGAVDPQALARGEDRRPLCAFWPEEPVVERAELDGEVSELEPLAFVLRPLSERAVARVLARGQAVARARVELGDRGRVTPVEVAPARPTASARTLLDLLRAHLAERKLEHPVSQVRLEITEEGELEAQELDLFERAGAAPGAVDVAVARLRAAFGAEAATGATVIDRHRPEAAWQRVTFDAAPPGAGAASKAKKASRKMKRPRGAPEASPRGGSRGHGGSLTKKPELLEPTVLPALVRAPGALRLLDPPARIDAAAGAEAPPAPPAELCIDGVRRRVTAAAGPTRLEAEWWTDEPLARDYYEVATEDGGRYWLYRDRSDGAFYVHGVFD